MTDGAFTISIVPETSGNERVNSACRHMNVWSFDLTAQEAVAKRKKNSVIAVHNNPV